MYPMVTYIMVCIGILFISWLRKKRPYKSSHRKEIKKFNQMEEKFRYITSKGEEIDIHELRRRQAEYHRTGKNLL